MLELMIKLTFKNYRIVAAFAVSVQLLTKATANIANANENGI